jgi:hypothetical protein
MVRAMAASPGLATIWWTNDWSIFSSSNGRRLSWPPGRASIASSSGRSFAMRRHGHMIIGTLRLFGFNVFRNTYKPLLSESILEFWNRYYYYFKELT